MTHDYDQISSETVKQGTQHHQSRTKEARNEHVPSKRSQGANEKGQRFIYTQSGMIDRVPSTGTRNEDTHTHARTHARTQTIDRTGRQGRCSPFSGGPYKHGGVQRLSSKATAMLLGCEELESTSTLYSAELSSRPEDSPSWLPSAVSETLPSFVTWSAGGPTGTSSVFFLSLSNCSIALRSPRLRCRSGESLPPPR